MIDIQVGGGRELAAKFHALAAKVQTAVMKATLDAAAEEAQQIASQGAPRGEGTHGIHLADSIEWEGSGKKRDVGPSRDAFWGPMVERGTVMRVQKRTGRRTGFVSAQPYMMPVTEIPRVQHAAIRAFLAAMEVV